MSLLLRALYHDECYDPTILAPRSMPVNRTTFVVIGVYAHGSSTHKGSYHIIRNVM
jgi:hypothetical protein